MASCAIISPSLSLARRSKSCKVIAHSLTFLSSLKVDVLQRFCGFPLPQKKHNKSSFSMASLHVEGYVLEQVAWLIVSSSVILQSTLCSSSDWGSISIVLILCSILYNFMSLNLFQHNLWNFAFIVRNKSGVNFSFERINESIGIALSSQKQLILFAMFWYVLHGS